MGITINRNNRLLNQHPQNWAGEIGIDDLAFTVTFAGAALDPDAGNCILAAASW
jgi:hypothetical protein